MELPFFKSNTKLPRGQFFYIQVGHKFYGGEAVETVKVEVSNEPPVVRYYEKGGKPSLALARRWAESGYMYPFASGSNRARRARDTRKGTLANYAKPTERKPKTIVDQHTGYTNAQLVDDVQEAKQFRRKDQVDRACERLQLMYKDTDVSVDVRYQGDTK